MHLHIGKTDSGGDNFVKFDMNVFYNKTKEIYDIVEDFPCTRRP